MGAYLAKRAIRLVVTLGAISLIVFSFIRSGGPAPISCGTNAEDLPPCFEPIQRVPQAGRSLSEIGQ